MQVKLLNPKQD